LQSSSPRHLRQAWPPPRARPPASTPRAAPAPRAAGRPRPAAAARGQQPGRLPGGCPHATGSSSGHAARLATRWGLVAGLGTGRGGGGCGGACELTQGTSRGHAPVCWPSVLAFCCGHVPRSEAACCPSPLRAGMPPPPGFPGAPYGMPPPPGYGYGPPPGFMPPGERAQHPAAPDEPACHHTPFCPAPPRLAMRPVSICSLLCTSPHKCAVPALPTATPPGGLTVCPLLGCRHAAAPWLLWRWR